MDSLASTIGEYIYISITFSNTCVYQFGMYGKSPLLVATAKGSSMVDSSIGPLPITTATTSSSSSTYYLSIGTMSRGVVVVDGGGASRVVSLIVLIYD